MPKLRLKQFKKEFIALPGLVSQVDVTVSDEGVSHPLRTSISQLEYLGSTRNLPDMDMDDLACGVLKCKHKFKIRDFTFRRKIYSFSDLFKPLQQETREPYSNTYE